MSLHISILFMFLLFTGAAICSPAGDDQYSSALLDPENEQSYRAAFHTYDLDDDARLDAYEMHQLFVDLFPISLFNTTSARNRVPKRTLDKLFVMLDVNGDGHIALDEFRKIWLFWMKPLLQPKSVLVLLNLQNDYVQPDGRKYVPGAEQVVGTLNKLFVRNRFDKVVVVKNYHRDNRYDEKDDIPTGLNLQAKYLRDVLKVINKPSKSRSAVYASGKKLPLYHELSQLKMPKSNYIIYLGGFYHDTNVMRTALDVYQLGFPVVLVRELTRMSNASSTPLAAVEDQLTKAIEVERLLATQNIVTVSEADVESLSRGKLRKVETGLMLANKFYEKYQKAKLADTTTAAAEAAAAPFLDDVDEDY